jgi:hypothetical protein
MGCFQSRVYVYGRHTGERMNPQDLMAILNSKIKLHSEVLKEDATGLVRCSNCDKLIRNHEYTKGLIYAYRDIMGLVAYYDQP